MQCFVKRKTHGPVSEHFQFETRCVSNYTACRFAEKALFFQSIWAGRRRAAKRFTFFKLKRSEGELLDTPAFF
ncbi:hypothetical protein [uncultured Desulfovibrio sp.]|uniref:hypothetical protein n=1 Tax=uncultured Desulfovibrio sp. TaxID=167968 RepID=UPI0026126DB0|nr:hypothetical protein [uncultured Desulfovibrio sp.]